MLVANLLGGINTSGRYSSAVGAVGGTIAPTILKAPVGIGTSNPYSQLDVIGRVGIGKKINQTGSILQITGMGAGSDLITLVPAVGAGWTRVQDTPLSDPQFDMGNSAGRQTITLNTRGISYLNGGNVGIGTEFPATKLHVVGNVRIGDSANPKGITLFDTVTGSAFCVQVSNGVLQATANACSN